MEFLLVNHPLDCPICDQAGECKLQEQATGYGRGYSRFVEQKNVKPKRTQLGPRVTLDDERCILCSRCIRFSQEIAKDDVLGFIDRGSYSTLTCYPGQEAGEQLLAQHRGHLPGRRAHQHGFPLQDARLVPQADRQHRHREQRRREHGRLVARGRDLPHHPAPERRGQRHLDGRQRPAALQAGARAGTGSRTTKVGGAVALPAAAVAAASELLRGGRRRRRRLGPQLGRGAIPDEAAGRGRSGARCTSSAGWGRATGSSSPPTAIRTSAAPSSPG